LLRRHGERWRKDQQQAPTVAACAAAHINPRIVFHGLRHTYASLCVMAGMPLMVLAQNLGHTTTAMCERPYAHLQTSFVDAEIARAAPRFGMVDKGNIRALRPKARANE